MTVILKDKGCSISMIGFYLVIIGAVNWGLVGLGHFFGGDWNVVKLVFGSFPYVEPLFYVVVGISGVMLLVGCKCKTCQIAKTEVPVS